jgi:Trypsin
MREPSSEHAEEKSYLGRKRDVGGHADENAEREPDDCADPDCGSDAHEIHPIHAAPGEGDHCREMPSTAASFESRERPLLGTNGCGTGQLKCLPRWVDYCSVMRNGLLSALIVAAALALVSPAPSAAAGGPAAQPRIVGGSESTIAQYPWQAALVTSSAKAPDQDAHHRQFCGGSLLTSRIVITAAHCVYHRDPDCNSDVACQTGDPNGDGTQKADPDDVDVVLSRTTMSNAAEGEELPVEGVSIQDSYDPTYGSSGIPDFDVAYLVLAAPAAEPSIKIAGTDESGLWAPGSTVEISGWGSTSETGDTVDGLRAAAVPMTSDSTCASEYGSNFDPNAMVCAGFPEGGVDTCYGDSGGPLQAPLGDGGYRLVGITSWGRGCAEPGYAGVWTPPTGSIRASRSSARGVRREPLRPRPGRLPPRQAHRRLLPPPPRRPIGTASAAAPRPRRSDATA